MSNHGLDQRRLDHFLAVTRRGSINRAAREIRISQAGLTKSIQTLEESLGVVLFTRGPKGVTLTQYGETLYAHAALIQNMYGSAVQAVEAVRTGREGVLKIGVAPDWFVRQAIPEVLARLLGDPRRPRFRLISGMNSWQMLEKLSRGELDMLVGAPTAFDQQGDFVFRQGVVDMQGVLVAIGHPLARARTVELDDLDRAGWVLAEDETFYRRLLTGIYQSQKRLLPSPLVTSHSNVLILDILARTGHVGVGTRLLARSHHPETLMMLDYPPRIERPIGVIHRRDTPLTDVGRLLIEEILEALAAFVAP